MQETASTRVWNGQFNIIDGNVREEGPNVGSFEGRPLEGLPTTLYVLGEPVAPTPEGIVGEMVQAMGQLFRQQDVSMTGNIFRTLRGAHESLYEWNRQQTDRSAWSAAGCSAAVVRGADVYLAQCGPAVAYALNGRGFQRLAPDAAARVPIGISDDLRPSLTHHTLAQGEVILLGRSVLADLATEEQLAAILRLPPEDALPELYLIAKEQQDFSLLLLAGMAQPVGTAGVAGRSRPVPSGPPSRRNPFGRSGSR